ncbi:MAG TPA: replicative DNA helicase, partial [Actinomycetota bacterium]
MARTADEIRRPGRPERIPPHNLEAEEAVLGSMMLSGEAVAQASEILKASDFYRSAHGKIYVALLDLYARGEPVDGISTVEELRRRSTLEEVGGHLFVHHLLEVVATPASAAHYARIVADHALLRRLIDAGSQIIQKAYDVPEDPEGLADEAEGLIYGVARHGEQDEIVTLSQLVHDSMESLERLHDREAGFSGLQTGFNDLDNLLQGFQPGNLIIVAARPGVGKSSLATNIARNAAVDHDVPIAMFSLEMSRMEIGMRLLCSEARIGWDKVRANRVAAEDWGRIVEAAEVLDRAPMFIVDSGNATIVDIRAKARRLKSSTRGLGLVIVDYLQLMSSHYRVDNRQQEIAEISRSLKLLAKELEIPVIAVSQLNRDPERRTDKRPQLADLRECVTGDTPVVLSDGRRVPIRDLVGTRPEVVAVSPEGKLVLAESDLVWRVGRRPVFQVRLASGRTIRATAEHRLFAASGWTRLRDLGVDDRLAIARRLPEPATTERWPELRVALLGQLVGDGSYLKGQPMRYATASEENSALVTEAASFEFASPVKRYAGRGKWHQLLISGNGNRWHPKGVNKWLRDLGIFGQRSHEKRLPQEVFRLGNEQVALLLQHLWATDGCIFVPDSRRRPPSVYFATASSGLASDVAALLLRLGIVARIRNVQQRGSSWYRVDVSGGSDQRRFLGAVGSFGPRIAPGERLRARLEGVGINTNVDTLPTEVFTRVRRRMAEVGVSQRAMAKLRGTMYGGTSHFRFSPSRRTVAGYAEILDDDQLRAQATSDLFWDRIVSIKPTGVEEVFDLTVPGPASWLADGIVSHNSGSLEQDADVVLLLHRDEMYTDEPDKKGLADVIVAKNRNGPTDKV